MKAEAIYKKGNWRVQVTTDDGDKLFLGRGKSIIFEYITFDSKEEAEKYIKNKDKLELKEEN